MARDRRTLALIIICLPILATVITAFRVRDLPKSHDGTKLDTKKTEPCEQCDVKVGQKVHSAKTESDKQSYVDLKKAVRDKVAESKTIHKYDVKSDEDDDENLLPFPKIQTGFRQEFSSKLSLSKSDVKLKISNKKTSFGVIKEDESDDDTTEDSSDDEIKDKSQVSNPRETKKPSAEKPKLDTKQVKSVLKSSKSVRHEENTDDDDDDEADKTKVSIKSKHLEVKKTSVKPKHDSKSAQIKITESKKQKAASSEEKDNDDDNSQDDNDDYEGLDNIDELFKILDMKPNLKSKSSASDKEKKDKPQTEIKSHGIKDIRNKEDDHDKGNDADDDDDSDDNDDDDDDEDENSKESKLKIVLTKSPQPAIKDFNDKLDKNKKISLAQPEQKTLKQEQKQIKQETKPLPKVHTEEVPKKNTQKDINVDVKKESKDPKTTTAPSESTKPESKAKEDNIIDKHKKDEKPTQKSDTEKSSDKIKLQTEIKKEEKKDVKGKSTDDKVKAESVKKVKDVEKEPVKSKSSEKDETSSSHEKIDKKPHEPKKDQTEHKDIFKSPDNKKDIKYDFEKPNAYKVSHKTFDYSEFEKIQVTKPNHKDHKKKEKTSSEKVSESREERYLKQMTDALNRRNLLKSEFDDFYAFLPTFAPNFSRIHNPECRRHGQILLRQLRGTKLWALNMLDATAKIPSGVLQGNGIQLGDFDQCLGTKARVQLDTGSVVKVQGKYCLARIELKAEHTELEAPVYLAQAKSLIRSRIDDTPKLYRSGNKDAGNEFHSFAVRIKNVEAKRFEQTGGHFVPRFSTLSWGVCVPAPCDREDVEVIVKDALKHYQHKSGLLVKVKVDEDDCHTDEGDSWEEWLELPTVLTLSFYGVIILLVLVATVQDFMARGESEEKNEEAESELKEKDDETQEEPKRQSDGFLSSFSLYYSINKLIAAGTDDEISCIHGIRGIATIALLVGHKFMPVASMPYTNRLKITEVASSPLWSWCRAGWIFTDCFLLLSGTLTSHRMASDSDTGALKRLFSRYMRLTPALLAVVLFYAFVWDKISTGPMWGTFVTKNAEVCEESWWWNLLYVQNYFGLENMCAPQTHQLALDMQLTIFGGIILWAVQSEISFARLILPGLHLLSAYLRYTTVRDHRLTMLAYHGVSVSQLYRTARLSYTSTLHRCSPYLIGLSLGIALKKPSKHGKFLLTLGWLTSIGLGALVVWAGIDSGSTQYRYNVNFAAQYATIAPIASAMAIAWIIYAVHSGADGFLSRVLCWRPLVFISRLSYALYLCQFIIFITNVGTVRTSREFTLMSLIDIQEISAILLSSILLTVTFVIPMQSLHKIFYFEWKFDSEKSPDKELAESESKEQEEKTEEKKELTPPTKSRHNLVAHREVLEEIPEAEVEYETQREANEGLDEIVEEEEEGTIPDDEIDDLEIIEEEEAGEEAGEEAVEEGWLGREERPYSRGDDRDLDEWEWTANGSNRSGAQYYRYAR